jgi:hypothetical protein
VTVDDLGQLRERALAVLRRGLLGGLLQLASVGVFEAGEDGVGLEPEVVEIERAVRRGDGDHLAVPANRAPRRSVDLLQRVPVGLGRDRDAGGEALDVPLERPRVRLVEVVDVEDESPVGPLEEPEVRDVGVTAELHPDARRGHGCEVGRHDGGRAA